jgi:hypothetical protein
MIIAPYKQDPVNNDYYKHNCGANVLFGRSNFLYYEELVGDKTFQEYVNLTLPDIVILTAGAHFHNKEDFVKLWNELTHHIKHIRKVFPKIKFYWKSQNPGHVECEKFKDLVNKKIDSLNLEEEKKNIIIVELRKIENEQINTNINRPNDLLKNIKIYTDSFIKNDFKDYFDIIDYLEKLELFSPSEEVDGGMSMNISH